MVILSNFPGLKVELIVDGQPIQEHHHKNYKPSPEELGGPFVAKYVESYPDKTFAIKITLEKPFEMRYDGIGCCILMDGRPVKGPFFAKNEFDRKGSVTNLVRGVEEAAGIKPFRFSKASSGNATAGSRLCGVVVQVFDVSVSSASQSSTEAGAATQRELDKVQSSMNSKENGRIERVDRVPTTCTKRLRGLPLAIIRLDYRAKEALKFFQTAHNHTVEYNVPKSSPKSVQFQDIPIRSASSTPSPPIRCAIDIHSLSMDEKMMLLKELKITLGLLRPRGPGGQLTPKSSPDKTGAGVKKPLRRKCHAPRGVRGARESSEEYIDISQNSD